MRLVAINISRVSPAEWVVIIHIVLCSSACPAWPDRIYRVTGPGRFPPPNHAMGKENILFHYSNVTPGESDARMLRFNHARAKAQCRSTVRGATLSAVAISGTVMPAK